MAEAEKIDTALFDKLKTLLKGNKSLIHCSNIVRKAKDGKKAQTVNAVMASYVQYSTQIAALKTEKLSTEEVVRKKVDILNEYFREFAPYSDAFSAQSKWRPTILEEFLVVLFQDLITERIDGLKLDKKAVHIGASKAYVNAYFRAKDFKGFFTNIQLAANVKNQDFAVYRQLLLKIGKEEAQVTINVPVFSIEVKTYLDKTMFEGAASTAEKIKNGNPYAKFYVVTEEYDVSAEVDPAYTRIDQIYVLRKARRRDGGAAAEISADVVWDLYSDVRRHLDAHWFDIDEKLKTGKLI